MITATEEFDADFLLEHSDTWKTAYPFTSAHKDESWTKVVVHGISIQEFNSAEGMETLKQEISTFNKDMQPIGTPYWLTSQTKRDTARTGSIVVAFSSEAEAKKALQSRLYIAGIICRTEKMLSVPPQQQCHTCQGFGHLEAKCKRATKCKLCAGDHPSAAHQCPAQRCAST